MKYLLIIEIILLTTFYGHTQSSLPPPTVDSNFYIYLALGQSNMAGRGEVTENYAEMGHPRLLMMDQDQNWIVAHHPVHFDKPTIVGVGPSLSFGIKMAENHLDQKIGLVPCAVGGTSIQHWKPGAYDDRTDTHPWNDAEVRIRKAMRSGVIKGVIWHQGESDTAPEKAANYAADLSRLIERIRDLVGDPRLPFVAGELGQYKEVYGSINRVLSTIPDSIPYTAVASSNKLKPKDDGVHFDAPSADRLGRRMAKKMKKLEKSL
ncbi:MAG TPA: sialate O-acetylesterase [Membranihabitans sp.]|nr:sialate O-acetylesterase [Membranihabitans sp.]